MVKVKEDLTGKVFDRLTVIEQADDYIEKNGTHRAQWLCKCSCESNKTIIVLGDRLKRKSTRSCGCLAKEHFIKVLNENRQKLIDTKHKTNNYDLNGEYGVGWTTNTNKEFYFDLEDYDKIKDYCWNEKIDKHGYSVLIAHIPFQNKTIKMFHLLGFKGYDHHNRNPLDNRKENLWSASVTDNVRNSSINKNNKSGFIGVSWHKQSNKWRAYITIDYKQISLGQFSDIKEAIKARLNAEVKYFGKFAPQRHLFEQYGIKDGVNLEI